MLQVLTATVVAETHDAVRAEADAAFDAAFGVGTWAMRSGEISPEKNEIDAEATRAASLEAGYEVKVAVTVLWRGRFSAARKD